MSDYVKLLLPLVSIDFNNQNIFQSITGVSSNSLIREKDLVFSFSGLEFRDYGTVVEFYIILHGKEKQFKLLESCDNIFENNNYFTIELSCDDNIFRFKNCQLVSYSGMYNKQIIENEAQAELQLKVLKKHCSKNWWVLV